MKVQIHLHFEISVATYSLKNWIHENLKLNCVFWKLMHGSLMINGCRLEPPSLKGIWSLNTDVFSFILAEVWDKHEDLDFFFSRSFLDYKIFYRFDFFEWRTCSYRISSELERIHKFFHGLVMLLFHPPYLPMYVSVICMLWDTEKQDMKLLHRSELWSVAGNRLLSGLLKI